ncbi:MAG: hypothetical protein WCU80_01650 [Paludibacteraceae bacterium]
MANTFLYSAARTSHPWQKSGVRLRLPRKRHLKNFCFILQIPSKNPQDDGLEGLIGVEIIHTSVLSLAKYPIHSK